MSGGRGAAGAVSEREQKVLGIIETARAKRAKFRDARITMAHGAGGKATQGLIEGLLVPALHNDALAAMADAGTVAVDGAQLALTTDSFVVKPIRFPGGSIGELAVNGTVNDLAVAGARPVALTLSLVLEEGLEAETLKAEVEAIAATASAAGVAVVAGDTKVVERGHADCMYICTTGLGHVDPRARLAPDALRPGDRILVSGSIGEHGTAIMLARDEFELSADVESDTCRCGRRSTRCSTRPARRCAACATPPAAASRRCSTSSRGRRRSRCSCARPPSRCTPRSPGPPRSSASTRCTWPTRASSSRSSRPRPPTRRSRRCGRHPAREQAAEIGEVRTEPGGMVLLETAFGGKRVMDMLVGDPLPRIC